MIEKPLVSIISPAYNHEKYIAECIKSVQDQTYDRWEMIIIDDGSTDSTFSLASSFADKDSRIKVHTQENIGIFRLAESYNLALSKASGKYIAILECDDVWLPQKLEKQIEILEKNPQFILSWGKSYISSGDMSHNYSIAPRDDPDPDLYFNRPPGKFLEKLMKFGIPALTIIIRKEPLSEIGGFLQGYGLPLVDMPTIVELAMKGEFSFLNEPLGYWRIYPTQVTKTYTAEMTTGFHRLFIATISKHPEVANKYGLSKEKIDDYFKNRLVISYSRSGRYKLIRKDFSGARRDYLHSIFSFGFRQPVWKLRSVTGILCSLFKIDVEWLARLIGNDSYK